MPSCRVATFLFVHKLTVLLVQFIVHFLLPFIVVSGIRQRVAAEAACHLNVERIETLFLVERAHQLHLLLCKAYLLHGVDVLLYVAVVCGSGDYGMSLLNVPTYDYLRGSAAVSLSDLLYNWVLKQGTA